ncbi:MAG: pyruvate kinase [Polyangiales bacterium]
MRRAKIVCTLGPASQSPEQIRALIHAGMDCARLNFSHGDHATHLEVAKRVRAAASAAGRPVALLADLCGPKMRIGKFKAGSIELVRGAMFTLTTDAVEGDETRVSVTYDQLPKDASVGDSVLLDDGLLRLVVRSKEGNEVHCEVVDGGTLSNNKGLNLPGVNLSIPALTDKDKKDLAFAVDEIGVDYVALSFVRSAADVREAQALAKGVPVIAKIEKPEAVENFSSIADVADGAMVARGDLGVELGSEKVPIVQKRIIREVNARGKIVITATQMLDSMIRNPRPTRAEAADVANAILDGTDAVMLSGETASGRYPVEAVKMMDAIVREVEADWIQGVSHRTQQPDIVNVWGEWEFANAAARSAALMSFVLPLRCIVCFTSEGRTARLLSEYRPRSPIVAITFTPQVAQRLALEWGVTPRVEIPPEDPQETLRLATALLIREQFAKAGDSIAFVVAWPVSERPNTVKLHRL